jgi:hypothetical protein
VHSLPLNPSPTSSKRRSKKKWRNPSLRNRPLNQVVKPLKRRRKPKRSARRRSKRIPSCFSDSVWSPTETFSWPLFTCSPSCHSSWPLLCTSITATQVSYNPCLMPLIPLVTWDTHHLNALVSLLILENYPLNAPSVTWERLSALVWTLILQTYLTVQLLNKIQFVNNTLTKT